MALNQGQVRAQRGFFMMAQTCPTCHAQEALYHLLVLIAAGPALAKASTLTIRIPAESPRGHFPADFRIGSGGFSRRVHRLISSLFSTLPEMSIFSREGDDLHSEQHISTPQAAMGCEISVTTMEEPVTIKIPPGTQSGALFVCATGACRALKRGAMAINS